MHALPLLSAVAGGRSPPAAGGAPRAARDYYVAAAFQNAIVGADDPRCADPAPPGRACHGAAVQRANLAKFDRAAADARRQGADIVVFNEGGVDADLWARGERRALACEAVPAPSAAAPCDAPDWAGFPVTRNVSCLARRHGIVVVVDTCDRQPCRNGTRRCGGPTDSGCCPASGYELFNTQLAFSETGALLAKYHKIHNYDTAPGSGETDGLCCWPPREDPTYFDTSFGVRFGMHICFDILFRTPGAAMALDPSLGVRDFVFSTHWETPGPPMLPAAGVQQAWSRGVGVNLIAANAGLGYAHAGSGIFSQGRALAAHYSPGEARDDRLLVARVPRLAGPAVANVAAGGPRAAAPPDPAPAFRAVDVSPAAGRRPQTATVVADGFACNLTLAAAAVAEPDRFLLMAVNGWWMGRGNLPSRSCVVVRCGALSERECAARASCAEYTNPQCPAGRSLYNVAGDLAAVTAFDRVELSGSFAAGDVVLPVAVGDMGALLAAGAVDVAGGRMRVAPRGPLLAAMLFAVPA